MKQTTTAEARWNEKREYWQCNVQVDGLRRSFYSSTAGKRGKHEAEAKAQEWANLRTGGDMTLENAVKLYKEAKLPTLGVGAQQQLNYYMGKILTPEMHKKRLSRINIQDWQHIIDTYALAGLAKDTINELKRHIVSFAKFCKRSRLPLEELEADDIENTARKEKKEKAILQPEALQTLFAVDTVMYYGRRVACWHINAFRLAAIVGLRRGEITALRWQDVQEDSLTVNGSVNRQGELTNGKTRNARRTIRLPVMAAALLDNQRQQLNRAGLVSPYVFPAEDGKREDPEIFYRRWKKYAQDNGIDPAVTFHCLRHTAVSLYKSDVPLALLKQTLGHSASMDTIGQYGHQLAEDGKRTADLMEKTLERYIR
jgi:integrase